MTPTRIDVSFHQHGTWGGKTFEATLSIEEQEAPEAFKELLGSLPPRVVLRLKETAENGPWAGMEFHSRKNFPGLFASGYQSPLSGMLYYGDIKIVDPVTKAAMRCPETVFSLDIGYLHINTEQSVTTEQKELLFKACFERTNDRTLFAAGATITRLFSTEEIESRIGKKMFFA